MDPQTSPEARLLGVQTPILTRYLDDFGCLQCNKTLNIPCLLQIVATSAAGWSSFKKVPVFSRRNSPSKNECRQLWRCHAYVAGSIIAGATGRQKSIEDAYACYSDCVPAFSTSLRREYTLLNVEYDERVLREGRGSLVNEIGGEGCRMRYVDVHRERGISRAAVDQGDGTRASVPCIVDHIILICPRTPGQ